MEKNQENRKNIRKKVEDAGNKFDTQSHILKNMTGRRLKAMNPGAYKSIQNPDFPVVKEGHWSNVPYEEQIKKMEVDILKVGKKTNLK